MLILGAVALVLLGAAAWYFLAPKPSETRDEPAPEGAVLREGAFVDGDRLHETRGLVRLLAVGEGHVLRFEDYDATPGPDVYIYLTPSSSPRATDQVEGEGLRLRTSTMTGQATLRGDFNVDVPPGTDVSLYRAVAIWCDTYNVLFGHADLG